MHANYLGKFYVAINDNVILLKRENCFILFAK